MKYRIKQTLPKADNYAHSLLQAYGIEDIDNYLSPSEENLCDYMLLDNITDGVKLLLKHLNNDSNIFILPDSDQDGITSAAILWNYIIKQYPNAKLHFKMHEGKQHGLTQKIIDEFPDIDLFITPDAGTNQFEIHNQLYELGKEVLVIDHHEESLDENNPSPAVIINNQLSPKYPNKSLCGAAMVLKFCMALDDTLEIKEAFRYYDLAAVGLIGDMMDLRHIETRYMVLRGLKDIRNPGLQALIEKQAYSIGDITNITPTHVSFYIAPLVNATLRVGTDMEKEILFRAFIQGLKEVPSTKRGAGPDDKETYASQNARLCANSRSRQNRIKDKAIETIDMIVQKDGLSDNKVIFVQVDNSILDSNLTGLVANQLMAKYRRPIIVARSGLDECVKGSGRNDDTSDFKDFRTFLYESGYFEFAEGHANAFGLSIKEKKVNSFIDYANKELANVDFNEEVYDVDFIFSSEDAHIASCVLDVGQLSSIWGKGLEEPKYVIEDIKLTKNDINLIGADKKTLKFSVNGVTYIQFKATKLIEAVANLETFTLTVVGRANLNEWAGSITPQIMIKDFDLIDTTLNF